MGTGAAAETKFGYVLLANGFIYCGLPLYTYGLKYGALWHNGGPVLGLPVIGNPYLNMILGSYFVLGLFLIAVSKDPTQHKSLLCFNIWGANMAHNLAMIYAAAFYFEAPYTFFGLPANISPIGDIPALLMFFMLNLYFYKQVFGTYFL